MKTPKEYTDNLKKGIITDEMACNVLFSYSKRAKNYRDRIRGIKKHAHGWGWGQYDDRNIEKCVENMEMLYSKKDDILKCYPEKMKCIHRQTIERIKTLWEDDEEGDYSTHVNSDAVIDSGVSEREDEWGFIKSDG